MDFIPGGEEPKFALRLLILFPDSSFATLKNYFLHIGEHTQTHVHRNGKALGLLLLEL